MRRVAAAAVAMLVLVSTAVTIGVAPAGAAVPAGFRDDVVASVGLPTAIAFTPDGRMLVTTQTGTVRIIRNQVLLQTAALNLSAQVCANSERGLLGGAIDPSFGTNGYVFLYYTFKKTGVCDATAVNRVSRFVMTGDTLGSETVLIDNIPSPAGNHNAGDLEFGKDGFLYVSVGDGGCDYAGGGCAGANDAARDQHALVGKILRITRDGGIPPTNPWQGMGTARCNAGVVSAGTRCQETFARGACAIRSGSPSTPTTPAPASSSTTWARERGRRSTSASPGPTTGGMCGKATAPTGRRPIAGLRRRG